MRGGPARRRGGGRGTGPLLPFKLARELGLPQAVRRGGMPPHRGRGGPPRGAGGGGAGEAGGKRRHVDSRQPGHAKRQRRAGPPAHTKFRELLEPDVLQGATAAAAEAEAALQRQLARKLGIKGARRKALAAAAPAPAAAPRGEPGRGTAGAKAGGAARSAAEAGWSDLEADSGSLGQSSSSGSGAGEQSGDSGMSSDGLSALAGGGGSGDGSDSASERSEEGEDEEGRVGRDQAGASASESAGGSEASDMGEAAESGQAGGSASEVDSVSEERERGSAVGRDGRDVDERGGRGVERQRGGPRGGSLQGLRGAANGGGGAEAGEAAPRATAMGVYVPPAARAAASGRAEGERLARRVTGLLNRLAEANVAAVAGELAALYESAGRGAVSAAVASELLQAVAEGPRATERFAAVAAALVAGLAALTRDAGVGARFAAQLAQRLQAAVEARDSLAAGNLAAVATQLYLVGLLPAGTLYGLLAHLRARFMEQDVALILALLTAAGFQLRRDDPAAMKDFVVAVHERAAEAAEANAMSSRAQVLLGLVLDIKNNRKRAGRGAPAPPAALAPAAQKFLKDAGVDAVQLRSLPWAKLLAPEHKGMWWLPTAGDTDALPPLVGAGASLAGGDDLEVGGSGGRGLRPGLGDEGGQLLRLAAAQRMSTEARRAVFCVVLGSQDCADALERLLRLPLKGEAQRELVRVTAECCLQERVWNPYYAHLLARLAAAAKGHRMTLQFCLWDHFKQAAKEDVRRLANLARLTAELVAGGALAPTVLKAVDFSAALAPRELLLWRAAFTHLLAACRSAEAAIALFACLATAPDLAPWRAGLGLWLRARLGPWLAQPGAAARVGCAMDADALLLRLRAAERALKGASGSL